VFGLLREMERNLAVAFSTLVGISKAIESSRDARPHPIMAVKVYIYWYWRRLTRR
jgi:hypothetical protein